MMGSGGGKTYDLLCHTNGTTKAKISFVEANTSQDGLLGFFRSLQSVTYLAAHNFLVQRNPLTNDNSYFQRDSCYCALQIGHRTERTSGRPVQCGPSEILAKDAMRGAIFHAPIRAEVDPDYAANYPEN